MSKIAAHPEALFDPTAGAAAKPKPLDEVRALIRRLNCSIRAPDTYVDWVRRFVLFRAGVTRAIRARPRSRRF